MTAAAITVLEEREVAAAVGARSERRRRARQGTRVAASH